MFQQHCIHTMGQLLQKGAKKQQILETLEISSATFKRHLDFFRDTLGWDIRWDRVTGIYQQHGSDGIELPGLYLTGSQVYGLLTIQELAKRVDPGILKTVMTPVESKLSAMVENKKKPPISSKIINRFRLLPLWQRSLNAESLEKVAWATMERRRLDIEFYNRYRDEHLQREISPQRLIYYRDNWYLDAWCHKRETLRTFSVDGILSLSILDTTAIDVDDRDLDAELGAGYGIFAGKEVEWAVLQFSPKQSRFVKGTLWHPDQRERMEGNSLVLEVPYSHDNELIMDILRFGSEVEVLAPPSLRKQLADRLQTAAQVYRKK